jgi:hypothetical protein
MIHQYSLKFPASLPVPRLRARAKGSSDPLLEASQLEKNRKGQKSVWLRTSNMQPWPAKVLWKEATVPACEWMVIHL